MSARKVAIIGIDGFDPVVVERLMREGKMPHCQALAERGSFHPFATTNPAQSPVAWATLATGVNPGAHGIFDFLRRDAATYLPYLSFLDPNTHNLLGRRSNMFLPVLHAKPWWTLTSAAGVPTTILKWPVNFPAGELQGKALSGFGTPDIRLSLGRYTCFTTEDDDALPKDPKGDVVRLTPGSTAWESALPGPNKASLPITFARTDDTSVLRCTLYAKEHDLKVGAWSPWVRIAFPLHLGQRIAGMLRFYVASIEPLRVYVSSVHADPKKPAFPLSFPESYVTELESHVGPFHTLGLPEETNGVIDELLPYEGFRTLVTDIETEREKLFWDAFDAWEDGVFAFVFDTIDRVQHIFWMTQDEGHPLHGRAGNDAFTVVIGEFYARMDALIGKAAAKLDDATTLFVLSDHGFTTFRRAFHLNSWLKDHGYLFYKEGTEEKPFFEGVDWSRTKAYALGFSGLYVNRAGREKHGIVADAEAPALIKEICDALRAEKDPTTGTNVCKEVYEASSIYNGDQVAPQAPDIVLGYARGYRVSWQTTLGSAPAGLFEDNTRKWSGDHLMDPSLVPGTFLSNRKVEAAPTVYDLAPTILTLVGAPVPPEMEGRPFLNAA